jgi:mannose-6-phosphate isomerase-like protein (cupin superfamily)
MSHIAKEKEMDSKVINLEEKLAKITEQWSPKIVAQMNDYHFKLAKLEGEFIWHKHSETDEVFMVLEGELRIDFRDGTASLKQGEMIVVPRGIEHKPHAENECHVMLIEPAGTPNTGDVGGARTVADPGWI